MAIIKQEDLPKTTINGVTPPGWRGVAIVRVVNVKTKPSNSGNRMATLTTEIVYPAKVVSPENGNEYIIGGMEHTFWLVHEPVGKDGKGSPMQQVYTFRNSVGIVGDVDIDDIQKSDYEGLKFKVLMSVVPNNAQVKNADGTYSNVVDPTTGQPVQRGYKFSAGLQDVLGRVDELPAENSVVTPE